VSIAWTTVETALHAWIVASSGLAANHVIWAQQNGPRPDGAFITMRLTTVRSVGKDWLEAIETAGLVTMRARGIRQGILSIQCFGGAAVGSAGSTQILDLVVSKSTLPSIRDALQLAGIGLAKLGAVLSTDGVINTTVFEPRATLEARFFLSQEVTEAAIPALGGAIQTAQVDGEAATDVEPISFDVGTPTTFAGTPVSGGVSLTWDQVEADSYVIYYDAAPNVSPATAAFSVAVGTTGARTITGIGSVVLRYFIIVAVLGGVESQPSKELTLTTLA
jgi:hypothetical protein